jgi:zinc resistance-associated protein
MWKTVLAGTAALAITGATLAYADYGPGRRDHASRWQPSAADITAFADARIAALKAGLELTPEQEKNWPAMESAMRELAKQRAERFATRRNAPASADPVERLSRRADALEKHGTALKKLADAAAPLYQSLDDSQKHRFTVLARMGGERFHHWRGRHGWRGHDGWHGRGGWQGRGGPGRGPGPQ